MTEQQVSDRLWKIAERAVAGLVPRPSISIEIRREAAVHAEEEHPVDGWWSVPERWSWELVFSQKTELRDDGRSPAEVAFRRASDLLDAAPELNCEGEEWGEGEAALTGYVAVVES